MVEILRWFNSFNENLSYIFTETQRKVNCKGSLFQNSIFLF